MRRPGCAVGGFFMDKYMDTRWSGGCAIEVIGAIELCICGELGVDAGAAEEVKSEQGLGQDVIPQVHGKVFVDAA
jgi:hypothetical protein